MHGCPILVILFVPESHEVVDSYQLEQVKVGLSHLGALPFLFGALFGGGCQHESLLVVVVVLKDVLSEVFDWKLGLHGDVEVFDGKGAQVLLKIIIFSSWLAFKVLVNEVN